MDIEAHGNDVGRVIKQVRDWLSTNHDKSVTVLPGSNAISEDYDAYLKIAPDVIAGLRLDAHDDMPHSDYLHVVEIALPLIEAARGKS